VQTRPSLFFAKRCLYGLSGFSCRSISGIIYSNMPTLRRSSPLFLFFRIPFRLPLLLIVFFLFPSPAAAAPLSLQVASAIQSILDRDGVPRIVLGRELFLNADLLPGYYRARGYAPAWLDDRGLTVAGRQLLDLLRSAEEHGLCPEDYHLAKIEPLIGLAEDCRRYGMPFDTGYMARLDLLLTDAFLLYAAHLVEGRVDPEEVHEGWRARPRKVDLLRLLDYVLNNDRLVPVLADLAPPHQGYLLLREELERHRKTSARGGWQQIPGGSVLRAGDSDPRLPLLRKRLQGCGDLLAHDGAGDSGELFDKVTADALARFQLRHGLVGDGVLGAKSLAALNVSVESRIRQIELNLERWRWLPKDLGDRHILVNIADFQLAVMDGERVTMTMPVVVGTAYRKTPVFSSRMDHLIFAPYWTVPPTILREDKLPKIKADPAYVQRQHFEIMRGTEGNPAFLDPSAISWKSVTAATFPGQLRQKPGPKNPLGRVKFMFPNVFDVYLHDTPDKHLFGRDARTFSSGCIRIQRPFDLASCLLSEQGWGRERILAAMGRSEPLRVGLSRPLPVHVLYWTAWVDSQGSLQFRDDIYLRDLDLDRALSNRRGYTGPQPQAALPPRAAVGG
jgi:murein L,D-transpeptidase YcbB/YkuD